MIAVLAVLVSVLLVSLSYYYTFVVCFNKVTYLLTLYEVK